MIVIASIEEKNAGDLLLVGIISIGTAVVSVFCVTLQVLLMREDRIFANLQYRSIV